MQHAAYPSIRRRADDRSGGFRVETTIPNLTILETAQAAGVSEEDIIGAEAEEPVSAAAVREIESLIEQLN